MKKIMLFIVAILCVAATVRAKDKLNVLTTTEDLKSVTQFIGGDKVTVDSLGRGTQDPHFLEAKPSYMMKAKKADLFIRVGLELEIGYEQLILDGSRNQRIQIGKPGHLDASEGIQPLELPTQKVDRSMGDIHPLGNPHYWLDPLNAKIIAADIAGRMSELSPENADHFKANLAAFDKKIDKKMPEWESKMAPFKGAKVAIYHRSWPYFFNRFGLVDACELEPKPGIPPSPGHLADVIEIMKRDKIKLILIEVFYDDSSAKFVADKTGAKVIVVPNSVGGDDGAKDYFSLIDTLVDKISTTLR